jgi:single-stranded DNA-binding protein
MSAQINLFGNIGKVEYKNKNLNLSLAVSAGSKDEHGEYKTDWYNCLVYEGELQDRIEKKNLVPGNRVIITGALVRDKYTSKDGEVREYMVVKVTSLVKIPMPNNSEGGNSQQTTASKAAKDQKAEKNTPAYDDIPF